MALDKITTDGETNSAWRTAINGGLDLLNSDILQADTTITIKQSGNESTTQCVVSGHTSATFNASDYSNDAAQTINTAIASIPKNLSGYMLTITFGDTTGQTIEISGQIDITGFNGDTVVINSAKGSDNGTNSATKANKIQSVGTSLSRLLNVYYNSCEINIQGLELIQNTSTASPQFIIVANHTFFDISYCKFTGGGTTGNNYGVLSQRGANCFIRESHFDNLRNALGTSNSGWISSSNNQHAGTQPYYGAYAGNGIILLNGYQINGATADYFATGGGLITAEDGIILEETVLTSDKTINIAAGSSASDIQAIINEQPKNLNGHNLTIQFADDTYDFGTTQIYIIDFIGGTFNIQGNTSDTGSGTYNVIIQGQNTGGNGIFSYSRCQKVNIKHIEFQATGSGASNYLIKSTTSTSVIENCKFLKSGGTNTRGVFIQDSSSCLISESNFSALDYAIYAQQNSNVSVVTCHDYGTKPVNGVYAVTGAIVKPMYTDIHSSTSNYGTCCGGLITSKSGMILDETVLTAAKTVRFAASNSSQSDKDAADAVFTGSNMSDLQNVIGVQPKNLNGHSLTFIFADGTYDFGTSQLSFEEFEGGTLVVRGNTSESPNDAGGGLSVIIQSQNTSDSGVFFFSKCTRAVVNCIRFEQTGTNTDTQLIRVYYNTYAKVQNSSFVNINGTQNNIAVYYNEANGLVQNCKFNNFNNNVNAVINSRVCSRNTATFSGSGSDQDSTNNIRSEVGSIVTQSGTKAGGADSKNEGVIFNSNGTLA